MGRLDIESRRGSFRLRSIADGSACALRRVIAYGRILRGGILMRSVIVDYDCSIRIIGGGAEIFDCGISEEEVDELIDSLRALIAFEEHRLGDGAADAGGERSGEFGFVEDAAGYNDSVGRSSPCKEFIEGCTEGIDISSGAESAEILGHLLEGSVTFGVDSEQG